MVNYTVTDSDLTSIANAIRTKGGTQASLEYPSEFISAINAIPTGSSIEVDSLSVSQNGTYTAQSGHAYSPVTVSVPQTQIDSLSVTQNGTYTAQSGHAYSPVTVAVPPSIPIEQKQVKFFDYDGTLLYGYTKDEINDMPHDGYLPAIPSHTGLIGQGWNWNVSDIKAQLTALPDAPIFVGPHYLTTNNKTQIDVVFTDEARLSPSIPVSINGRIEIDWGDNTSAVTYTGDSLVTLITLTHLYASTGSYTISINRLDSNTRYRFFTSSSRPIMYMYGQNLNEARAYANCIKSIRIGSGILDFQTYSFAECYSLETITIPYTVTAMEDSAFKNCYQLKSLTIPKGLTYLPSYMCQNCKSLKMVSLPNTITSIPQYAFSGCYSLETITIPSTITDYTINSYAFNECCSLKSVFLPSIIKHIGGYAFYNCSSLQTISIPNTATEIWQYAFSGCRSLETITMPNNLTTIEGYAFDGCTNLYSVTLPNGLITIGSYAFRNCYSLRTIVIPNTVTGIGQQAFIYCRNLASVTIPSGVTEIKSNTFNYCDALASVTITNGVTTIGSYAFSANLCLASVTIPSSVTNIANYAFSGNYCLNHIHMLSDTPPTLGGSNVFQYFPSYRKIYVPYSSDHSILDAYKAASYWSNLTYYLEEEPQ